MAPDRTAFGKMVPGKIALDKIALGRMAPGRMELGRMALGKMVPGKMALGKMALGLLQRRGGEGRREYQSCRTRGASTHHEFTQALANHVLTV